MLDNVSAIQFFLAIAFVMALIILCAKGALYVYRAIRRRVQHFRVKPILDECRMDRPRATVAIHTPRTTAAPQNRHTPRDFARLSQVTSDSALIDDGLYTRVVTFPQDVA